MGNSIIDEFYKNKKDEISLQNLYTSLTKLQQK